MPLSAIFPQCDIVSKMFSLSNIQACQKMLKTKIVDPTANSIQLIFKCAIGGHQRLPASQRSSRGNMKTYYTNNAVPTAQHIRLFILFQGHVRQNEGNSSPTQMESLQQSHGKLTCHPSCRGEGRDSSTISCTILLMPPGPATMSDEHTEMGHLEFGTHSVELEPAGACW